VNLFVTSVERSLPFYTDVCGFEQVFDEPEILAVFLGNGNSHHDIALMGATSRARVGRDGHVQVATGRGTSADLNHLGFEIDTEADLVAAIDRAQQAGFAFHRVVDHQISHSVYLFDPDGNYIEVYADVTRDWRGLYADSQGKLITGTWKPHERAATSEPMYEADPEISVRPLASLHPTRVARATLVVADLATSRAFYERVVGLTVVADSPELGGVVLGGALGQPDLALVQQRDRDHLGLHHFSVELPSLAELDAGRARLAAAGIPIDIEPVAPSKRAFVVSDPDGLKLEFFVDVDLPGTATSVVDRHYLN
jgi:catechol 2,3-dioxygenase